MGKPERAIEREQRVNGINDIEHVAIEGMERLGKAT